MKVNPIERCKGSRLKPKRLWKNDCRYYDINFIHSQDDFMCSGLTDYFVICISVLPCTLAGIMLVSLGLNPLKYLRYGDHIWMKINFSEMPAGRLFTGGGSKTSHPYASVFTGILGMINYSH